MNDQNSKRRMDFGAGRGQMSPEMMEAQRRLAEKQQSQRENQAAFSRVSRTRTTRTPGGATVTRTQTAVSYSATSGNLASAAAGSPRSPRQSTPVNVNNRPAPRMAHPARPATGAARPVANTPHPAQAPAPVSARGARPRINPAAPSAAPVTSASAPQKEPTGPQGAAGLETLDFDNLSSLTAADALSRASSSPQQPPVEKSAQTADKKHNQPETASKKPKKGFLDGKSPFINTLNIEKRPLSGHSVNKKKSAAKAPKPEPYLTPNDNVPTVVQNKRKNRKSNIALGIAIFLTVILGAVVGTFVYLAFFQ